MSDDPNPQNPTTIERRVTTRRRVRIGSATCGQCAGRGEVQVGDSYCLCPVCRGNTVLPVWKETPSGKSDD